ncbi:tRNA dimethylallyltransferase [Peptoniphilus asaccharolyticus DSM 20463]|uniref:tRNA dimethylallyltransferase n=1 Tax=Peptoniphilus asaccharolyticus DSM 20463 TaxID=573058 RepID=A0A1W1UR65_PEPAS|nr:tRNA (adenosine(37)-N6)-dimethylallyltransferase MiaA [Peptoniphilus asaccharolyticus]MBL7575083.1 tRNA (adenosine(37)-N6)-dimethylallyltransferase MiaA [Peptoniphilus asaccharolyticus]SMB83587.1 tRNA dimethylallyltransferase [Peptoniphilus asaccharolyticus DSM 20463]
MNLIILTGPTGVGKTELSLKIAEKYNGEIISADSMQIYRKFDIGTAKIDCSKTDIVHHMIDIVDGDMEFSVYEFQQKAKTLIEDINKRNKMPILVGGTGLYINSIVYNLTFQESGKDDAYREHLNQLAKEKGLDYLYAQLVELDPNSAELIDKNNSHRIIRALEIAKNGKKDNSSFNTKNEEYNLLYLGLNMDRAKLYDNINKRVDQMMYSGLLKEVNELIKLYPETSQSFKAIGYKEVLSYIKGEITSEEMSELIKKNSRHYAKRQLTWFKRDDRIVWLDREDEDLFGKVEKLVGEKFGK